MNYYYLAYGSNMNKEQMKKRCPSAEFIKADYLKGCRLEFNGYSQVWNGPVANIVKNDDSSIPYVLWSINKKDLEALNGYEGVPNNKYKNKKIKLDEFYNEVNIYEMTTNNKNSKRPGQKVSKEYENTIRNGYKYFGLLETYLDKALEDI